MLRSSYPPGQPGPGVAPKPLGFTPTSVNQIMFPGSLPGTLFSEPVLSGPTPGVGGAVGAARLTMALLVDYTMGNFNLPITFPGGSFLLAINSVTFQAGLTTATIQLGQLSGAGDIVVVAPPAKGATAPPQQPGVQLPLWDAVSPYQPFTCWLGVGANTGETAGGVIVLVDYARIAGSWSLPAKNFNKPGS